MAGSHLFREGGSCRRGIGQTLLHGLLPAVGEGQLLDGCAAKGALRLFLHPGSDADKAVLVLAAIELCRRLDGIKADGTHLSWR